MNIKVLTLIVITFIFSWVCEAQKKRNNDKNGSSLTQQQKDSLNTFIQIDRIFIVGNKKTKEHVIRRELDITSGQVLTKKLLTDYIEEDKNKIFNMGLFNSVDVSVIDLLDGKVDIIFRVTERWYFFPVPIFKLADRNFTEWWVNQDRDFGRVEWGLKLRHFNFRGRNEKLDVTAQFGFTKLFSLAYAVPYVDKAQKIGISLGFEYSTNKNIAINTIEHRLQFFKEEQVLRDRWLSSFYLNLRPSFYNFHRFGIWYSNVNVQDTIAEINPNYLQSGRTDQKYLGLTYRFRRDLRDYRSYPLKGHFIEGEINKYGLGFFGDLDILELNAIVSKYFDLGKKFYASTNVSFSATFPNEQPYRNYNGIGFDDNFIRGYEVYVIEGPFFIINNNAFKKEIFSRVYDISDVMAVREFSKIPISIYVSLFYDHGYVENYPNYEQNTRFTNKYIYGAGVGLDLVTMYDSVLRFEYSINKAKETGFRLNIHAAF